MSEPLRSESVDRGWERPRVLDAFFGADAAARDAHGVIDASAGTGKTYTLEHLVLELVAGGAPIEEILVVTFTDKATREMKQRVRARLLEARTRLASSIASRAPVPEAARLLLSRLTAAVAGFDRAAISTIHAFCQRALAEHAFASGRPFTFERTDGRESFGRAVRQAVRVGLASGASQRAGHGAFRSALVALRATGSEGAVARLEALLHAWMREPGEMRPAFEASETTRALLATPTTTELLSPAWAERLAEVPSLTARARIRDALLELATELAPHRDDLASALERGEDPADQLAWGPALAWASSSTDPRGVETNAALCAGHLATGHLATLADVGRTFATLHRALGSPVPYLVHTILPRVRELWTREKRETSTLDFDDMLTALRDALASDVAVRRALRHRYRHALVDEFQDTDEVQWEIFRRLFVDRDDDDDAPEAAADVPARTLFVIGDVKQAIYGFRSADVHTFEDACRTLERAGAARAVLDQSFRSSPAMLDALDRVFAARAEPPLQRGLAGYTQRITSGVPERCVLDRDGREAPAVVIQHLVGAPELRLPLIRRALADAIAKEIRAITGEGLRLRDDTGGAARAVKLSDVFVLTRSAAEGRDVAEALRRHAVPHAFFKQDGLFRTREAADVLDVLRAVADRHDRNLTTRALLGPFFGVPLAELPAAYAIEPGHPLARRLTRWASLAEHGQLAALFSAMLDGAGADGSGLARRELYLHEGERVLVNLRHLFEWLLELGTRRRLSVAELGLELSQRIERAKDDRVGSDDEDVQKLESEREAVQILTMHKSKGLEAEVVFVFGGWGKPPKRRLMPRVVHERVDASEGGRTRVRRVAWAVADDGIAEKDVTIDTDHGALPLREALRSEARAEDERLYYVALTRAKRRLYLPYFGTPPRPLPRRDDVAYDPPHLKGSYAVLNDRLRAIAEEGVLTSEPFSVTTIDVGPRTRTRAGAISLPRTSPTETAVLAPLAAAERARLVERHAGFEVTSYTRMKSIARARAEAAGEASQLDVAPSLALLAGEMPIETLLTSAREPGGARFGVLVHGVLEDLLRDPVGAAATSEEAIATHPAVLERLRVHAPTEEERSLALGLAARAMTTPLDTGVLQLPGGVASLARRVAELPFLFPVPERAHASIEQLGRADGGGFVVERGYVRGVIDLLFEHEGRVYVLDWKTDRLAAYDEASLRAHVEHDYRVQIALYTLAALRIVARSAGGVLEPEALHARFGGLVYVFVRGLRSPHEEGESGPSRDGVLAMRPSLDEVLAWERAVRREEGLLGAPLPMRRAPLGARTIVVEEP